MLAHGPDFIIRIFPLGGPTPLLKFLPLGGPTLLQEFFPLRAQVHSSADGSNPTQKRTWIQLCWWDFSTRRPKVCRLRWWDYPHSGITPQDYQTTSRINHHTGDRDQHSEEAWTYQFWKANSKASQARSKQTFSFQRHLYIFYSEKSFHSEYIPSNRTRLI